MLNLLKNMFKSLQIRKRNPYFCSSGSNNNKLIDMEPVVKKRYTKPVLLKHGVLRKLTLKLGSMTDGGLPREE